MNADLVAPRKMKPWQKIENLKEDGSFKEKEIKSMANSITEAKTLNETDAREFDILLEEVQTPPTQSSDISKNEPTTSQTVTTATSELKPKTTGTKLKSVIVKIDDKKKENDEPEFVVKRHWAWQAETDEDKVYFSNRRTNCLEAIRNLKEWTKNNVVDYEPGKLFETLLSTEELFSDPGLETHQSADVYLEKVNQRQNSGRSTRANPVIESMLLCPKLSVTVIKIDD